MNIRIATPEDYSQIAKIRNLIYPDIYETDKKLLESDKLRENKIKFCRWVAEVDNKIIGEAYYTQHLESYHPNKFFLDIVVLPEFQNQGIGSALYNEINNKLKEFDPIYFLVFTRENHPSGIKFASQRDFKEVSREIISHLDVQSFDLNSYHSLLEKLQSNNFLFKRLSELKEDPNYEKRLYELEWQMVSDIPSPNEPLVKQTFEEWKKSSLNHPEIIHDSFYVALKDGDFIGYSSLWGGSDKVLIHNGMVGVQERYRGNGIATILKVFGIKYAKDNGYKILWTSNSIYNTSMLKVNKKLGYKKQYENIELIKSIRKE